MDRSQLLRDIQCSLAKVSLRPATTVDKSRPIVLAEGEKLKIFRQPVWNGRLETKLSSCPSMITPSLPPPLPPAASFGPNGSLSKIYSGFAKRGSAPVDREALLSDIRHGVALKRVPRGECGLDGSEPADPNPKKAFDTDAEPTSAPAPFTSDDDATPAAVDRNCELTASVQFWAAEPEPVNGLTRKDPNEKPCILDMDRASQPQLASPTDNEPIPTILSELPQSPLDPVFCTSECDHPISTSETTQESMDDIVHHDTIAVSEVSSEQSPAHSPVQSSSKTELSSAEINTNQISAGATDEQSRIQDGLLEDPGSAICTFKNEEAHVDIRSGGQIMMDAPEKGSEISSLVENGESESEPTKPQLWPRQNGFCGSGHESDSAKSLGTLSGYSQSVQSGSVNAISGVDCRPPKYKPPPLPVDQKSPEDSEGKAIKVSYKSSTTVKNQVQPLTANTDKTGSLANGSSDRCRPSVIGSTGESSSPLRNWHLSSNSNGRVPGSTNNYSFRPADPRPNRSISDLGRSKKSPNFGALRQQFESSSKLPSEPKLSNHDAASPTVSSSAIASSLLYSQAKKVPATTAVEPGAVKILEEERKSDTACLESVQPKMDQDLSLNSSAASESVNGSLERDTIGSAKKDCNGKSDQIAKLINVPIDDLKNFRFAIDLGDQNGDILRIQQRCNENA